jgi:predicted acetyltransferase
MSIEVRSITPDEVARVRDVLATAFGGGDPDESWNPVWENVFETDRIIAAYEGDEMVGVAGNFTFDMTIPGGTLPTAGLTIVGVLPTHRRKGILNKLMRAQFEDAQTHGESASILWASEEIIYQRFGYGMASRQMQIELDRGHGGFRNDPGPSGRTRLLTPQEALKVLPGIYDRVRAATPGMLARHAKWWEFHRLFDPKSGRDGASPMYRVVWENDGQAEGYALYRIKERWNFATGLPEGEVWVLECVAASPDAHRELWRYIYGIDLAQTVKGYGMALDDPLPLISLEPRHLRLRLSDALWLRVVDVKGALSARSYAADDTITFELTDAFCPWNEGRWTLTVSDSEGTLEKASNAADIALDTFDLGATYLGGTTFNELARGGRVAELTPGAIHRADSMFRTDRQPWHPEIF